MSNWIIHVVGETIDDDLGPAVDKFVKEIQSLSHKVHQVRLTTDTGEKVIHVTQDVAGVVDAIDPAATPAVAAVENEVDKEVTSHEEPPATPAAPATPTAPATPPILVDPTVAPAPSPGSSTIPTAIPTA